jgi:adenine-specific DNA-methyltransferase
MQKIKQAIAKFSNNDSLVDATKDFFSALNIPYQVISTADYKATDFFEKTDKYNDKITKINTVALIDEKALNNQFEELDSNTLRVADKYDAIGVFAVELLESNPTRTTLVEITRAINREMEAFPVAVIFKYGNFIALASTERTDFKSTNRSGEKVGKVSIIRDIDTLNTHPGHLQILQELSIQRTGTKAIKTFDELYKYWYSVFNVSLLNKKFYQELSNWYFWALREVKFPNAPNQFELGLDDEKFDEKLKEHNGKNVIRLLTRILFVWFIKEKGLIPEEIFDEKVIADRFIDGFTPEKPESSFATGKQTSKYYRAIIQNLFFATLNQPQGKREFRNTENRQHHNVTQLMRYKEYIKDPEFFIQLMEDKVPFMNGGLFECLDKPHPTLKGPQGGERIIYVDGFSDRTDNEVEVPDYLFFDKEEELDLSNDYGDKKKKKEITRGLITILKNYKFTITENTPIEEEVALDPELLGKVFENLLASYNPETKSSARKQTGSFYTPREIVNYMVEESLIAYLKNKLDDDSVEYKLRELVSFSSVNPFDEDVKTKNDIIKALDECTILDPACGSGAYPMGILQKMVHILHKIDPKNEEWKQRQIDKVNKALEDIEEISDETIREKISKELKEQIKDIEESFESNELDYGRKLYLIENCIYGVDIQAIATQISKLRFFISLVVDQKVDISKENFGIRPLPNLETKFVAANTLIGLDKSSNLFDLPEIKEIEKKLKKVRHELFAAKTKKTKNEKRKLDKELREQIASKLEDNGFGTDNAKKLAAWDPYDQNTSSAFFDKEWMFDKSDGFDIVIGNPPYIKEATNKDAFNNLKKSKYYMGKMDLWYLFACSCTDFLKEKSGNLCFIATNNWVTSYGAKILREKVVNETKILKIIDFNNFKIFDSADIQTMVFLWERNSDDNNYIIDYRKLFDNSSNESDSYKIILNDFEDNYTKINPTFDRNSFKNRFILFAPETEEKILLKIASSSNFNLFENGFKELKVLPEIGQGIVAPQDCLNSKSLEKLGANYKEGEGIFYLSKNESDNYIWNEHEKILIKPMFGTSELFRYWAKNEPLNFVIYTGSDFKKSNFSKSTSKIKISNYPNITNHLDRFSKIITSSNKPYGLHRSREIRLFEGVKIMVLRKCSDKPIFTYTDFPCYVSQTFNIIKTDRIDNKFLTGLLNSKLIEFWLRFKGKMQGSNYQLDNEPLSQLPLIKPEEKVINKISKIVEKIIILKEENNNSDISILEKEIDVLIYKSYKLSFNDAIVIDSTLSLEDFEKYKLEAC